MALRFVFGNKLDTDDREPVFKFTTRDFHNLSSPTYGVLLPSISFWTQMTLILILDALFAISIAYIVYYYIIPKRGTAYAYLLGYGLLVPSCLLFPSVVIPFFDVRNKLLRFTFAAAVPALSLFHTMEAMHGFSPPVVETSFANYALYYACPLNVAFDAKTNARVQATMTDLSIAMQKFGAYALLLGAYKSLLSPTGYEPFETNTNKGRDTSLKEMLHFSNLLDINQFLNNAICAVHLQLYLVTFFYGVSSIFIIIYQVKCTTLMNNPLFECTSPSDFWGKRWNLVVHGALKRGVFKPVYSISNKALGVAATFFASGLFHEWILTAIFSQNASQLLKEEGATSSYPIYGLNIAFFFWNATFLGLEYLVGGFWLFRWMSSNLPRPFISACIVSVVLPVTHWFTHAYTKSGYFEHGQMAFPMIVRLN